MLKKYSTKRTLISMYILKEYKIKKIFFCNIFLLMLFMLFLMSNNIYAQDDSISNSISNNTLLSEEGESENDVDIQSNQVKIINLEILTDLSTLHEQTLYVGQYITIKYRLTLLDDARIVYTEFNPSLEQNSKQQIDSSVKLVEEGEWQKEDDYYTTSYTFKIIKADVTIPSLVVHVQNNYLQDSMQTSPITLKAQSLSGNSNYCGVVANNLKIVDYTLEGYDDNTNMILIEIEGNGSNLEDFKLPRIKDQEFGQGTKFGNDMARVNLLARIPKSLDSIDFSYFDINKREFIPLSIQNTINVTSFDDEIKEDLNPKSSFLKITNIIILVFLGLFLLLTLIKRSYVSAIASCLLLGILIYRIFANTYSIKTLPNARVLIQPTQNSTELLVITNPTKLEAIDKKNNYYKVNIDSKVGWINRNDTNKR